MANSVLLFLAMGEVPDSLMPFPTTGTREKGRFRWEMKIKPKIGVIGFEPTAPSSQNWCSSQAELHPVGKTGMLTYVRKDFQSPRRRYRIGL